MAVELKIPSAGESITEVQIGSWLKDEGDFVELDESVVELETDKASMELPAPARGVLSKILKRSGEIVPIGTVIGLIEEQREVRAASGGKATRGAKESSGIAAPTSAPAGGEDAGGQREPHVMPAARRALAEAGLQAEDVSGSGPGGRILKEDVQRHVADAEHAPAALARAESAVEAPASDVEEDVVPMSMLRRRIAQRLVESQQTTAALTTFNEIDMSAVMTMRKVRGEEFFKQYGVKLGIMSVFVKAAIEALKELPAVNAEVRGTDIVYKNHYDIGIAVSTDQGLVVPVVRNAERLSFAEIEQRIADLAARARERKISIEELQGGTFTITNGGVFGSLLATPIINPPQSAILGLHAIKERPIAVDGQVVIRPMMYVALTYDHRVVDGRESVTFLRRVKECVEDPARMLIEA